MRDITAILIDDEISAINTLRGMLGEFCTKVRVLAEAHTIDEAVQAVSEFKPDVVFLDIEIPPFGNGFDFLRQTNDHKFGVIFMTAYPHYAVRAINDVQPWAYLIKPFRVADLVQAVQVATAYVLQPASNPISSGLGILVSDFRKGNIVIRFSDIIYCQADGSHTNFFVLRKGKLEKIIASRTLKEVEADLPNTSFCRVHHSFIVNMAHIERYDKRGRTGLVYLPANQHVDVSNQKMDNFVQQFSRFLKGKNM